MNFKNQYEKKIQNAYKKDYFKNVIKPKGFFYFSHFPRTFCSIFKNILIANQWGGEWARLGLEVRNCAPLPSRRHNGWHNASTRARATAHAQPSTRVRTAQGQIPSPHPRLTKYFKQDRAEWLQIIVIIYDHSVHYW